MAWAIALWVSLAVKLLVQLHLTWGKVKAAKGGLLSTSCLFIGYTSTILIASWRCSTVEVSPLTAAAGLLLFWAGSLFRFLALLRLGRFFSSFIELRDEQLLVRDGVYGIVRHPLHLGFMAEAAGMALLAWHPAALVSLLLVVVTVIFRNPEEERALAAHFGSEWDDYAQDVPAMNVVVGLRRWWSRTPDRNRAKTVLPDENCFDGAGAMALLEGVARPRRAGTAGNEAVRGLLREHLESYGATVTEQPVPYSEGRLRAVGIVVKVVAATTVLAAVGLRGHRLGQGLLFLACALVALAMSQWVGLLVALVKGGWLGSRNEGRNIIATFGAEPPKLVLMAHYDTVSLSWPMKVVMPLAVSATGLTGAVLLFEGLCWFGGSMPLLQRCSTVAAVTAALLFLVLTLVRRRNASPGAIDNGSGVVLAVEAARRLASSGPCAVVLTDCEELGLLGAIQWGLAACDEPRPAVLNIDMPVASRCGPTLNVGFGLLPVYRTDSGMNKHCMTAARDRACPLGTMTVPFFSALDHFPLVQLGYRATGLTGVSLHIHSADDGLEHIEQAELQQVGELVVTAGRSILLAQD